MFFVRNNLFLFITNKLKYSLKFVKFVCCSLGFFLPGFLTGPNPLNYGGFRPTTSNRTLIVKNRMNPCFSSLYL